MKGMSTPAALFTTSLSYDHLSVRCLLNFFIFFGADALSQSIARTTRSSRRRRRRKSIVVDLDEFNLDRDLSSTAPLAPSSGHARSLRFASFGALVHAPACSLFFGTLDARFPGKGWREVSLKLAADRATLAPALLLVVLLWMRLPVSSLLGREEGSRNLPPKSSSAACLETLYEQGKNQNSKASSSSNSGRRDLAAAAAANALRRLPLAYALSCLFWVPAHSLGFAAVPPRWRVLYVALASLVWNCVLAGISSEPSATTAAGEEEEEQQRQRRRQRRRAASPPSSSPASSLPLFTRQTRKARWSDSAAAAAD